MAKHYFEAKEQNLTTIQQRLVLWFKEREYEVNHTEAEGIYLIQAKKTGTLRTLTGTNLAFKIKLYWSDDPSAVNEFIFESSTGKWISNLAGAGVSAMFTGGFTILTGIAGAGWALVVEHEITEYIENTLKFKKTKTLNETDKKSIQTTSTLNSSFASSASYSVITTLSAREKAFQQGQQDLAKLEAALKNDILTEAEFTAKKAALELKIDEYEIEFAVEEQSTKLEQAFVQGILEESEYGAKVIALRETVKERILKEREQKKNAGQIAKLKVALENGILSQAEYDAKVAVVQ
jgi:hypothetical protein